MEENSKLKVKWWHIEGCLASFCIALTVRYLVRQEWMSTIILGAFAFIFTILGFYDYQKDKGGE